MKTRSELVYEFMVAITSSYSHTYIDKEEALLICNQAENLADQYLKFISGV